MNNTFKQVAETFVSNLGWDELAILRGCISERSQVLLHGKLRSGEMPWADDDEMRLCEAGERIKAIKAYRNRTWKAKEGAAFYAGYYPLVVCKSVIDATWRVYEVASFVVDYLKDGKPGDRVTFFNILDAHSDSGTYANPRGFDYDELRDALDLLLRKNIIGEEVPEDDETKTTDIWLLDWNKVAII